MIPENFPQSNKELQPSGKAYSDNVESVKPLYVWTDNEQCVSCWRLSWRERLAALWYGKVWAATLSGGKQPPMFLCAQRSYFLEG
jgi:hypothetical protein